MAPLTDVEKFQLWESNGYPLYYKLRDIELYFECLQNGAIEIKDLIAERSDKDLSVNITQDILSRLRSKIKDIKQVLEETEKIIK